MYNRGAEETFEISTVLTELTKTLVNFMSAEVKTILFITKTLEYLETMGVPIIIYGSDDFPDFFTQDSGFKTVFSCVTPDECAAMIKYQK